MVKTALFCSGKGSHLETVELMIKEGLEIEPVFFFSNKPSAPCNQRAKEIFPDINALSISHTMFSRPEFDSLVRYQMDQHDIELVLFLGYMRVVTPVFLHQAPPIINIHPSLLPSFKGKDAIQQAIDAGVTVAGVTAHYVNGELDGGPIIMQEAINIKQGIDHDVLKAALFIAEQRALISAVRIHLRNQNGSD